jgi:hypothetical protein
VQKSYGSLLTAGYPRALDGRPILGNAEACSCDSGTGGRFSSCQPTTAEAVNQNNLLSNIIRPMIKQQFEVTPGYKMVDGPLRRWCLVFVLGFIFLGLSSDET